MPNILCLLKEDLVRRMIDAEAEALMRAAGSVTRVTDFAGLSAEAYAALFDGVEGVITGWGTPPVTVDIARACPTLRIISHTAGSMRHFPRELLERGIVFTNALAGIARTVAETSLYFSLLGLRGYAQYADPLRYGGVSGPEGPVRTRTLFDKNVGLVGFGNIGRIFRELLRPFNCRVRVYDPFLDAAEAARRDVEVTDLHDLFAASDVISLHAPAIPSTEKMIAAAELALIRDGSVLVNTARGQLIDNRALIAELRTNRFVAALDVITNDPPGAAEIFRRMPNVFVTPHIAGPTEDDLPRQAKMALEDLRRFFAGEPLLHEVTLDAYDRMSF